MVEFRNRWSGGVMYVHESRVEEYEALGHVRVLPPSAAPTPPSKREAKGSGKRKAEKAELATAATTA